MLSPSNDKLSGQISEIKNDLKRDNVRRALNRLSDVIEGRGREASRDVRTISIQLMAEYARVEMANIGDRLPHEQISRIIGNISRRAIELCDALEDDQAQIEFTAPDELVRSDVQPSLEPTILGSTRPSTPISPPQPFDSEAIIEARGISRNYNASGFRLEPLDLKVMAGKILAIIGVNGSGKSTLLDILRGEAAPDSGTIRYPALSPDAGDWSTIRRKIGYVPQRSQPWRGTVLANLEYAAAVHGITGDENVEWTNRLLARHGLTLYRDRKWNELSAGFRMRFDLALSRVNKPKLLILDEPLGNLDIVSQQSILFDLVQLAQSTGTAIIITSQHLYETEAVANELLLLVGGKRLLSDRPRSQTFFEVYWPKGTSISEERIFSALEEFQPRQIKVGTTLCLIGLAARPTLEDIVAKAREKGLALTYVRDVTESARVDMEQAVATSPV